MIYFKITNGQRLVQVGRTWIGADTSGKKASFTVNRLFNGTLTAYFGVDGLADVYPVTLDASNKCTIPAEVLVTSNMPGLPSAVDHIVNVSVQDLDTTTSIARFPVYKTASGDNKPPVIPDSDAYDKLVAMIPNAGSVSGNSMIFTNGNKQLFIVDVSSLVGGSGGGSNVVAGVSSVNGKTGAVTIDLVSLGGEKAGTAVETVAYHNADTSAHADIRSLIQNLSAKISNFLDSDDTTLDQLSELITYIKSNKDLIDYVTTNKVNVTDIVNDLNTNTSTQPLSAAQGVALRRMIESVTSGPGTGEGGGYYTPTVKADGTLTWTPSKSDMPQVANANIKGPAGANGKDGQDGKTPVKGIDYFTTEDKTEMAQEVADLFGDDLICAYDENNEYTTSVDIPGGADAAKLVLISSNTPSAEEMIGKYFEYNATLSSGTFEETRQITQSDMKVMADNMYYIPGAYVVTSGTFEIAGMALTQGIWAQHEYYDTASIIFHRFKIYGQGVVLDDSAIPDTVVRKDELADLIQDVLPTWTGGEY